MHQPRQPAGKCGTPPDAEVVLLAIGYFALLAKLFERPDLFAEPRDVIIDGDRCGVFLHVRCHGLFSAYALGMGTKAAKKVDFERLADALSGYRFAYLVTVDDDYRVHTVTVEPELREQVMDVGLIGGRTRRNVESRSAVTLLWPPSEPGGYSLIVDGTGEITDSNDDTAALRVVPTRALLHRNADPTTPGSATGCLHDCVVFATQ
jgi:hypothetical protein